MTTNPWKGVVPYSGDKDDLKRFPFKGRDKEILQLLDLIDNNAISTLYGKSGIGKTSLIKAGLMPKFREKGCSPIYIKLHNDCLEGQQYAQYITDCLSAISVPAESASDDDSHFTGIPEDMEYLWQYFATHHFNADDKETIPIIIIDQFEETLRKDYHKSVLLLQQLRAAKQEKRKENGTFFEVNFRFLISLREDDLYLLEDAIDKNLIDQLKTGRYRLLPIEKQTAIDEVIFIREGLFSGDKDAIAERLISLSMQEGAVSSLLLSLVCSMTFEAAKGKPITIETIDQLGHDPLITFYKKSIKNFPLDFIDYFEERFVDIDRKRIVLSKRIPSQYLSFVQRLSSETNPNRLLTIASNTNVNLSGYELLHDKIAEAIGKYHTERINEAKRIAYKKKIYKWFIVLECVLLLVGLCYFIVFLAKRPITYHLNGQNLHGQSVPVYSKPYYVKDGVLHLSHCTVEPYTFYDNKEVRKLILDSVLLIDFETSLYLPNVDTLIIGANEWNCTLPKRNCLPNLKVVCIHEKPQVECKVLNYNFDVPVLQIENINSPDSVYVIFDSITSTLWGRNSISEIWKPFCTKFRYKSNTLPLYVKNASSYKQSRQPLILIDLNIDNIPTGLPKTDSVAYRLFNSDTSRTCLMRGDIPDSIVKKTRFVYFRDIDTIRNSTFSDASSLQSVKLMGTKYIDKFAFSCCPIEELDAPQATTIGDCAFYQHRIKNIVLDSVKRISYKAIEPLYNEEQIERIWLPVLDTIAEEAFGWNKIPSTCIVGFNPSAKNANTVFNGVANSYINEQANTQIKDSFSTILNVLESDETIEILPHHEEVIFEKNANPQKTRVAFNNRYYFSWQGNLYKCDLKKEPSKIELIKTANEKVYIALPDSIFYQPNWDKIETIICLDRSKLPTAIYTQQKINLYVPYGQRQLFQSLSFKGIYEIGIFKTLYYNIAYGTFSFKLKFNTHKFIVSIGIEPEDIYVFLKTYLLILISYLLFYLFIVKIKKTPINHTWTDIILGCLLPIVIGCFYYFVLVEMFDIGIFYYYTYHNNVPFTSLTELFEYLKNSDDTYRSFRIVMTPVLWSSIILWSIYLVFKLYKSCHHAKHDLHPATD